MHRSIIAQLPLQSSMENQYRFQICFSGVHFGTTEEDMIGEIRTLIKVFGTGVVNYIEDHEASTKAIPNLSPALSCASGNARWQDGTNFYR